MLRTEPTAEDSLADTRARVSVGMAIAAMMRMIATTINSSISENPFCACIGLIPLPCIEVPVRSDFSRQCLRSFILLHLLGHFDSFRQSL
jgi:hypothetical protein